MSDGLGPLLDRLASVGEETGSIVLDARVIAGPSGTLRILVGAVYFDVDPVDVLSAGEPDGSERIRIALQPGARLRDLGSTESFRDLISGRTPPFAIAIRSGNGAPRIDVTAARGDFRMRERAFLERYGLRERNSPT